MTRALEREADGTTSWDREGVEEVDGADNSCDWEGLDEEDAPDDSCDAERVDDAEFFEEIFYCILVLFSTFMHSSAHMLC